MLFVLTNASDAKVFYSVLLNVKLYHIVLFRFCFKEERIETVRGSLLVAIQGDQTKPAIITYHDLGLNRK